MHDATVTTATSPEFDAVRAGAHGAAVASIGISVPETVVPNAPIAKRLGVDDEWIAQRTGIHSRHIAGPGERLADLAGGAGRSALERAGIAPADIDLVLVATTTPDEVLPNAAPLVADAVGAAGAGAMDVGAACTGFLSALALATGQIEAGRARNVLVVGADIMSRITDPDDRRTAGLFADGAGAAVLTDTNGRGRIGPVTLGSDAAGMHLIRAEREEALIRMQGQETFRHAVARLTAATREAIELAGATLADIDLFVYHQANARILRAVGERLAVPAARVIDCIERYGNTSAATLPLALAVAERDGRLRADDLVLLGAFGAGFTWGASVIRWGAPARQPR